jgi:hypothetical protein
MAAVQSIDARRKHPGGSFRDGRASLHQPQSVPAMLLLQTPNPTSLQAAVYRSFCTPSSAAIAAGGSHSFVEQRFKLWLQKLRAFTDAHSGAAYHNLTDDPQQEALVQEVKLLAKELNDPLVTQNMALQLFQCASAFFSGICLHHTCTHLRAS